MRHALVALGSSAADDCFCARRPGPDCAFNRYRRSTPYCLALSALALVTATLCGMGVSAGRCVYRGYSHPGYAKHHVIFCAGSISSGVVAHHKLGEPRPLVLTDLPDAGTGCQHGLAMLVTHPSGPVVSIILTFCAICNISTVVFNACLPTTQKLSTTIV